MTHEEFNEVLEARFEKSRMVLAKKAGEYARGDRLSNFKKAAGALQCTPHKALVGMWMKHIISIIDMVDDMEKGKDTSYIIWDEKIGDAINYLILLDGLVCEGLGVKPTQEVENV
ncbi:MAG: hypothetical protein GXP46_01740 [Deferribacteres bacterium]|nr:hypothetical protein [Deferribacteres bacterium]